MEYIGFNAFKRTDGSYSIKNMNLLENLSLVIPTKELAEEMCKELESAYHKGFQSGYDQGYLAHLHNPNESNSR